MLDEISINAAEAIPYRTNKEKLNIMLEELLKNRYIEIGDKFIYSVEIMGGKGMKTKDLYKKYKPTTIEVNGELRIIWVKKENEDER